MAVKFQKGTLYKVRFYDHCVGQDEVITCEAIGWLEREAEKHIVLNSWQVVTKNKETRENNRELVSILKSCIISTRKY